MLTGFAAWKYPLARVSAGGPILKLVIRSVNLEESLRFPLAAAGPTPAGHRVGDSGYGQVGPGQKLIRRLWAQGRLLEGESREVNGEPGLRAASALRQACITWSIRSLFGRPWSSTLLKLAIGNRHLGSRLDGAGLRPRVQRGAGPWFEFQKSPMSSLSACQVPRLEVPAIVSRLPDRGLKRLGNGGRREYHFGVVTAGGEGSVPAATPALAIGGGSALGWEAGADARLLGRG